MRLIVPATVLVCLLAPAARAERVMVDPAKIRLAVESAFREAVPEGTSLEVLSVPTLSHDRENPRVLVRLPDEIAKPGPRAIPVSCEVNGREVSRGLAAVVVRVTRPVWVTGLEMKRGTTLDWSALRRETRVFDREPPRLFESEPKARWRLTRNVASGVPLRLRDVRRIPDVETGAEITLLSRAGQASVAVTARVRRAGDVGDVILVHNPVTGTLVRAVLLDETTALLDSTASQRSRRHANGRRDES